MSAEVDLGFDASKVLNADEITRLKRDCPELSADMNFKGTLVRAVARGAPENLKVSESDMGGIESVGAAQASAHKPKLTAVQPD